MLVDLIDQVDALLRRCFVEEEFDGLLLGLHLVVGGGLLERRRHSHCQFANDRIRQVLQVPAVRLEQVTGQDGADVWLGPTCGHRLGVELIVGGHGNLAGVGLVLAGVELEVAGLGRHLDASSSWVLFRGLVDAA